MRTTTRIPIHTRPIDEAERVGLDVAAEGRIVAAVPVVMQAGFGREPLTGEPGVERGAAGDAVNTVPGLPDRFPDRRRRAVPTSCRAEAKRRLKGHKPKRGNTKTPLS
jgi:hypothetical protein